MSSIAPFMLSLRAGRDYRFGGVLKAAGLLRIV